MSGTVPESKNIGSSRNSSAIILLNKHNIKPIPDNLLYSDGIQEDPQLVTMQRTRDFRVFMPTWGVYITTHVTRLSDHYRRGGVKSIRAGVVADCS